MRRLAWVLALMSLTAGCTPGGGVRVTLDEYTLRLSNNDVTAGLISFRLRNVGAITHEFAVLRTRLAPAKLPVRRSVVRLHAQGLRLEGRVRKIPSEATDSLSAELTAGRYVLICNVPGHYQSGMRAGFRVR